MSQQLISRSADLQQLRDEGYELAVRAGYLLVTHVPYVNAAREVEYGTLVTELTLAGDKTAQPRDHVAHFVGGAPCSAGGVRLDKIITGSGTQTLAEGVVIDHSFSSKPPRGNHLDYYEKVTTYVAILESQAHVIDQNATARTFAPVATTEDESVFMYMDTASTRAGISLASDKLKIGKVAIVGVGGTGSYVLDLIAKCPIGEIHIFDGDKFFSHNAFRSPGAPSIDELRASPYKVHHFAEQYSKMHRHVVPHDAFIDASNVEQLAEMDFVFLCMDSGGDKRVIVDALTTLGKSFIDVGMGINLKGDSLFGILRITTSTASKRDHVKARMPFMDSGEVNEYAKNIQIADLNALNAALAVLKWKKMCGFYVDLEGEHFTALTLDGNSLVNEDNA